MILTVFKIKRDQRTVEEKLREGGFIFISPDITSKNFPLMPPGGPNPEKAVLVNFGECLDSEEVVEQFSKMGFRPGFLTELLDLSKSCPGKRLVKYFPIVALGDPWINTRSSRVPYLLGSAFNRELGLLRWDCGWRKHWWFLAFHLAK